VIADSEDLLVGPSAFGVRGDVRLENGSLVAVVASQDHAVGFAWSGGNLIDLAAAPAGEDHLNQVFLYLEDHFPRQARYDTVTVLSAGGGAAPAIVRACGVDTGDPRIRIETDYRLEPGAEWLTLESRFTQTGTATIHGYRIGDAIHWGRAEHLAPGHGFDLPGHRVTVPWVAAVGSHTSYGYISAHGLLDMPSGSVWSDPIGLVRDLEPNRPVTYVRHLLVGDGDTASLSARIGQLLGQRTGRLSGWIRSRGEPVADAQVQLRDATGALIHLASADADGAYAVDLVPGRYRASVEAPGRDRVDAEEVLELAPAARLSRSFELAPRSAIAWRIEGDDGRAPPVKVTIVGAEGTPNPNFGPPFRASGAREVIMSAKGMGEAPVGAGRYRVLISRGPEYELIDRRLEVKPGARPLVEGRLVRSVATPGYIAADLHQHAAPSFDSGVSLADRALSNASEGVEVLVATEHNTLSDYRDAIAASGLGRHLASIVGVEATTHSVGHFNAFPLVARPGLRNGMEDPEGWPPSRIFEFSRSLGDPAVPAFLQVNHPRAGQNIGYLNLMRFDAASGRAEDPRFSDAFDGMEIINFGFAADIEAQLADWFALLRAGRRITATGGSDAHTITGREVGWPRTFVCVDQDDPSHLDASAFTAALHAGCASVSGGPFIWIRSGATPMGGLARSKAGQVEIEVEVAAPTWIATERLRLYVDGEVATDLSLPAPSRDSSVRHHARHTLRCATDCFIVARVDASASLAPVLSTSAHRDPRPIAITNPIYVDVDGDGAYRRPRRGASP
jgi:hypothetical protein